MLKPGVTPRPPLIRRFAASEEVECRGLKHIPRKQSVPSVAVGQASPAVKNGVVREEDIWWVLDIAYG